MIAAASSALVIRSAEGVSFSIPLAGPLVRFLAWAIDLAAIAAILFVMNGVILLLSLINSDAATGVYIAVSFAVVLGYGIVLEWFWRGQTIGKRFMRLRVKDERGLKLRFDQVLLRNLLRVVDILPALYMAGGLSCLLSRRNQRLGDIAAGTVVVHEPATRIPGAEHLAGDKYNSFRGHPHLEARLRQLTPPAASALALEAIARREAIDAEQRLAVFASFAQYFRSIARFPDEDTIGLTDEQYVRNVIDSIYNTRNRPTVASASGR